MSGDEFTRLFKYIQLHFGKMDSRFDKVDLRFDSLEKLIDQVLKNQEINERE